MVSIFLDTNLLFSRSSDFSKARFAEKIQEISEEIEVNDLYSDVNLVIPQIVIDELYQQQKEEYSEAVSKLSKIKVPNVTISFPDDYDAICKTLFDEVLDSMKNGMVKIVVAPYPPNDALSNMIDKVIHKAAPFEGKDKQSDKGFKDALIWETVIAYKKAHSDAKIFLYSQDGRLTDKQLEEEFQRRFGDSITMVRKNNPNSHEDLIKRLSEIEKIKVTSKSFIQELKDRLIDELCDIPDDYIIDRNCKIEVDNSLFSVDYCSISNVVIDDIHDEEGIIRFDIRFKISLNCSSNSRDNTTVDFESKAVVNYQLSNSTFYFKGCENYNAEFGEFSGLGAEL